MYAWRLGPESSLLVAFVGFIVTATEIGPKNVTDMPTRRWKIWPSHEKVGA